MKKFIDKIQDLSQRAAQVRQVVEAAPSQAAQLREAVLTTASQLQQMRHEVQSTVAGLRVDSDDRLAQALREIHDHAAVFAEAGYTLSGVDMELSPIQRLVVHLDKVAVAPESSLRSLISAHAARPTVHGLLSALAKADAASDRLRLSGLTYRQAIVHVGPTPTVRLCWRAEPPAADSPVAPATRSAPPPGAPPPLPTFGQSSFFEARRPAAPSSNPTPAPAEPTPPPSFERAPGPAVTPGQTIAPPTPANPASAETSGGSDWKRSALDRFKKMPEGSKYRRLT